MKTILHRFDTLWPKAEIFLFKNLQLRVHVCSDKWHFKKGKFFKQSCKEGRTDLKVQNYGPDQSQSQFGVAVCDVIISDIYKFDLVIEKVQLMFAQDFTCFYF